MIGWAALSYVKKPAQSGLILPILSKSACKSDFEAAFWDTSTILSVLLGMETSALPRTLLTEYHVNPWITVLEMLVVGFEPTRFIQPTDFWSCESESNWCLISKYCHYTITRSPQRMPIPPYQRRNFNWPYRIWTDDPRFIRTMLWPNWANGRK